jgi:putative membrane protein
MKAASLSFVLALPLVALGADSSADATFYKHASEGGMAEVELGNLAQQKSSSQSVKDFGAMMVADHTAANDKLKAIAASKNIKLPTSPSVGQEFKKESVSGEDADAKAYATATLPTLQAHLKKIRAIAAAAGVS